MAALCLTAAIAGASVGGAHAEWVPVDPTTDRPVDGGASKRAALPRPDCGGQRLRKPGGGYWRCSFADGFNRGRLNPRRWVVVETARDGYQSGPLACFVDRPRTVEVKKGSLRLRAAAATPFLCRHPATIGYLAAYVAGSVSTHGRFQQTYGRFQIRVKFPRATRRGLHSAVWLNPSHHRYGPWPASGEIDVAELFTQYPDRLIPYVHYVKNGVEHHDTNENCYVSNLGKYHDLLLVWTRRSMTVRYDGKLCLRARPDSDLPGNAPFDAPFDILLTQALGVGTNLFLPGYTPLPATMKVDFVRVWR